MFDRHLASRQRARKPLRRLATATVLAGAALAACASGETVDREQIEVRLKGIVDPGPSDRFPREGLIVDAFDLSDDNIADLWKIYSEQKENLDDLEATLKLVRKEVDSNFDRKVDIWFHYNHRELLFRQESDADFDGDVDLVEYYEAGRIVKREVFRDGQAPAATKHYREGRLVKIEADSDGNGAIDTWEIYSLGQLVQVGYDRNGDGKVDYWDDYAE